MDDDDDDDDAELKEFLVRVIPFLWIPVILAFQCVASRALRHDMGVLRGPAAAAPTVGSDDDEDALSSRLHGIGNSDDEDEAEASDGSVSDGIPEDEADDLDEPEDETGDDPMDAAGGPVAPHAPAYGGGPTIPKSKVRHDHFVAVTPGLTASLVASDSVCAPVCARCELAFPDMFRYRCHDCLLGVELCTGCHVILHGDMSLHNWRYCNMAESCAMRSRPADLIETVPVFRGTTGCNCPAFRIRHHKVMVVLLSGACQCDVQFCPTHCSLLDALGLLCLVGVTPKFPNWAIHTSVLDLYLNVRPMYVPSVAPFDYQVIYMCICGHSWHSARSGPKPSVLTLSLNVLVIVVMLPTSPSWCCVMEIFVRRYWREILTVSMSCQTVTP